MNQQTMVIGIDHKCPTIEKMAIGISSNNANRFPFFSVPGSSFRMDIFRLRYKILQLKKRLHTVNYLHANRPRIALPIPSPAKPPVTIRNRFDVPLKK